MPKMTDRELLALVNSEFSSAMGAPDGEISAERAKAWDYYLSKKFGNEVEGQSSVVTSDVADIVDSIMPSLLRLFTTTDNLVSFDPVGPEDVQQAEQESDYVNYVFFKQNDAFLVLYNWAFDGLLQKNGIVKCWIEDCERVTTESYSNLTNAGLFNLLSDEELEPVEKDSTIDNETGEVLHDVTCKRTTKQKKYCVANVPPEEYRISADARTLNPCDARMVGQERPVKRAELLAMGFDAELVDLLPAMNDLADSDEKLSRYNRSEEEGSSAYDRSQDEILLREVYIQCDYEGKGRSELRQVFCTEGYILSDEPADRQPFHVWSPQPLPHKHFGRATAEKVMDTQLVASTVLRQTLDNLYHTNNPSHAIWEQGISENTLDDILSRRVGGLVRFDRPIGESWAPMTVPFTAQSSFEMLAWLDKTKRDRTGVHSDAEGLNPEQMKHVQQSVMGQAMDMSRMKIEAIARIFAETGIKSLFLHLHELIAKHGDKKQVARLRNQWVEVDPARWRARYDVTINIGLGIASKETALLSLNQIVGLQEKIIQNGGMGMLVSPQNIYNTAAEFTKASGLKSADLYFTNPQNQPPPQGPSPEEQLQQAQLQLLQAQQQNDAQALVLKQQKQMQDFQIALAKLQEEAESREDKWMLGMEGLKNEILGTLLDYKKEGLKPPSGVRKYNPESGAIE